MGKKKKRLSSKKETSSTDKSMDRLKEMVLDHLGIPRPGQTKHIQELQDNLLPTFMESSRQAWLATSPMTMPDSPILRNLSSATETYPQDVQKLNDILEDMGVHDLLRDVAASPDVSMLKDIPLDPYEQRLLRVAGHPNPDEAAREFLRHAAKDPSLLASPSAKLEEAGRVSLSAHGDINIFITQQSTRSSEADPNHTAKKPKKRKLFTGLGKLFSGTVLVAGNAAVIPTVTMVSVAAIPVLGSLAAGIAAVGEGVGQLLREGDQLRQGKSDGNDLNNT
jgi:hypothetical protein